MLPTGLRGFLVATFALALLTGCGGGTPSPSISLLPLARPVAQKPRPWRLVGQGGPVPADRPAPVRAGASERQAVITGYGAAWEMDVELAAGDRLVFAVTAPRERVAAQADRPAEPVAARVVLQAENGEERALAAFEVTGIEWADREVPVESPGTGTLRLESPAGAVAWAGALLVRSEPAEPSRPNLILVSLDTVRADRLGVYGNPRAVTPHLDRLAESAWVFERAFSTSTWTLPSHASLFTGLLPAQHGCLTHQDRLAEGSVTVAGRLRELGYHTVAITDGGFLHPRWGLAQGFDRWDWTEGQPWEPKDVRRVVATARQWMEANGFEPYFLFVHTYEAHQPYTNPEGFADPFLPPGASGKGSIRVFDHLATDPPDPAEAARALAFYDGGVARADHYLGGWLTELADAGRLADTAVVVTSDHGEEMAEHGGYEHGAGKVFDVNVRVPLLVRPPGGVAMERVRTPATSLDVMPSLLAWAGAADPRALGRPLAELAAADAPERPIFVHGLNSLPKLHERRYRVDQGDETVIFDPERAELSHFDRAADPAFQESWETRADGAAGIALPSADDAPGGTLELLARAQAVAAWAEGDGFVTRLPAHGGLVQVRRTSSLEPLNAWDAVTRHPLSADRRIVPRTTGWPGHLVFDLNASRKPREIFLQAPDQPAGAARPLPLTGARFTEEPGWCPVDDPLPAPGEIFRAATPIRAGELELDDEARRELEALGYL